MFKKTIHFFCAHTVIKQFFRILIQNKDIKQVSPKKKCGCVHIFVAIILPHSFEQPIDYEQSLFLLRFSESNACARERRSRETRETREAAIGNARGHLRVSRFVRRTTEKRETARSLVVVVASRTE